MARGVHGPILEALGHSCNYHDMEAVEVFRQGGDMVGVLKCTGNGTQLVEAAMADNVSEIVEMEAGCQVRNEKLVDAMREDKHANELLEIVMGDVALGRMAEPCFFSQGEFKELDLSEACVAPAFTVEQGAIPHAMFIIGLKPSGDLKLRAVYNFTASQVNACTKATEKLRCDTLDAFVKLIMVTHSLLGVWLHLRALR